MCSFIYCSFIMLGCVEVGSKGQYIENKLGQWRLKQSRGAMMRAGLRAVIIGKKSSKRNQRWWGSLKAFLIIWSSWWLWKEKQANLSNSKCNECYRKRMMGIDYSDLERLYRGLWWGVLKIPRHSLRFAGQLGLLLYLFANCVSTTDKFHFVLIVLNFLHIAFGF